MTDKKDNNGNDKKGDYEVGYGKPPKNTRFGQPGGNKGNTKGRKKGSQNIKSPFENIKRMCIEEAYKEVAVTEDGEVVYKPKIIVAMIQLLNQGVKGDKKASALIMSIIMEFAEQVESADNDLYMEINAMINALERTKSNPGSLEYYYAKLKYFKYKQLLRKSSGEDKLPYEYDEPQTSKDWMIFYYFLQLLEQGTVSQLPASLIYTRDLDGLAQEVMDLSDVPLKEAYEELVCREYAAHIKKDYGAMKAVSLFLYDGIYTPLGIS